jgi:hypothetical protein
MEFAAPNGGYLRRLSSVLRDVSSAGSAAASRAPHAFINWYRRAGAGSAAAVVGTPQAGWVLSGSGPLPVRACHDWGVIRKAVSAASIWSRSRAVMPRPVKRWTATRPLAVLFR